MANEKSIGEPTTAYPGAAGDCDAIFWLGLELVIVPTESPAAWIAALAC